MTGTTVLTESEEDKQETRNERMLQFVIDCIARRLYPGQIKTAFAKEFDCAPRSAERWMTRAKEALKAQAGQDVADFRADAIAFYNMILASQETPIVHRLKAMDQLTILVGANAPTKVAATDTRGNDIMGMDPATRRKALLETVDRANDTSTIATTDTDPDSWSAGDNPHDQ
jgi:hypothetical protein